MIKIEVSKAELEVIRQALIDSMNYNVDVNDDVLKTILVDIEHKVEEMEYDEQK